MFLRSSVSNQIHLTFLERKAGSSFLGLWAHCSVQSEVNVLELVKTISKLTGRVDHKTNSEFTVNIAFFSYWIEGDSILYCVMEL